MTGAAARWSILAMTQDDGDFPEALQGFSGANRRRRRLMLAEQAEMKMKMKTETHQISDQPASSSCSCKLNVLCTPQDVDSRCRCAAVSSIDREYAVEMRICQQQPERPCDAAVHGCRNCRRSRVTSSLVQRPAVLEVPATLRGFVARSDSRAPSPRPPDRDLLFASPLFDHFPSFSSHIQMLSGPKTGVQIKTQLDILLCSKQDPELALARLPQPSIRNVQQPETTAHLPSRLAFYHYSQLPQGH
ncbi:hypothetical protein A7C99_5574 [Trichophyton rubrum]|uniref:Uncharacterized protein n=1 Tax=Trichophyton rubrum TaxID=5551 RepID=A0A178ETZ6_TRIRU|nr:hypothetical protein A7C99_5574 [Trichophyton rubrum]